jgi:selenocysteine lyase/cysteine desulfurase
MTALNCQKHLFSIPSGEVYLNSAYMGPLATATVEAGQRALARRATPLTLTPEDFFAPAERARALCAALVGADPEAVALVPTAADGLAIVAHNLAPRAGQNVVVLAQQFPSNVYPWRRWSRDGIEMRAVAASVAADVDSAALTRRARDWNERLLAAIDSRTALVALEPAHWTDGTLFGLEAVAARARAVGAALVVDATQVAGAMPIDCAALRPDALVVHCYKSMLANYGLGFAVLGPRFADGRPLAESWLTRRGSEDFSGLTAYTDEYAAGMRRFDTSIRANPVLIDMLVASAELLVDWQPARVRSYLLEIARPAVERLRAAGFGVADEPLRAANLFGVVLPPGRDPRAIAAALKARRIHVSVRGSSVRVAPHVYNDAADLDRFATALSEVA